MQANVFMFKLSNGEEINARYDDRLDHYLLEKPHLLVRDPNGGMGGMLVTWFGGSKAETTVLSKSFVVAVATPVPELEKHYLQSTSTILLPGAH